MKVIPFYLIIMSFMVGACMNSDNSKQMPQTAKPSTGLKLDVATFAGGCFWCMEQPFEELKGVEEVVSGYTGGHKENPSYEEVCKGTTGHLEAVQVRYDPEKISYDELLNVFWQTIDPTDSGGQFTDRGSQYKTAIFFHNDEQRKSAEESKRELEKAGIYNKPIVTEIIAFSHFYEAEDYHQDYYKKCPLRYKTYKSGSGRDHYLKIVWKDKDDLEK